MLYSTFIFLLSVCIQLVGIWIPTIKTILLLWQEKEVYKDKMSFNPDQYGKKDEDDLLVFEG